MTAREKLDFLLARLRTWWAGSWRSLTIAFNALIGALAAVALAAPELAQEAVTAVLQSSEVKAHLAELLGPRMYALTILAVNVVNIGLRFRTREPIPEKGARAIAAKADP